MGLAKVCNRPPRPAPGLTARSPKGHKERFPPTRLSAGYGFRKETIAGTRRNGRDAPIPAGREAEIERQGSTQTGPPAQREGLGYS